MTLLHKLIGRGRPPKHEEEAVKKMSAATQRLLDVTDAVVHDLKDDRWFKSFPTRKDHDGK